MAEIEWSETLSVGVESIDAQHKKLIALTNKLFSAILQDEGHTVAMAVLIELKKYVAYHFSYEEQLLMRYEYPMALLQEHVHEHRELAKQVDAFIEECNDMELLDLDVYAFLRDWTTEHLNGTDKKYVQFFADNNVK